MICNGGESCARYAKQLLPTYNVFDEHRHFEPGPDVARVLRIGHTQVGLLICEDGWNDDGLDYAVNPFARLARRRARPGRLDQRQPVRTWASASSATRSSARRAGATACRCCT